MKKNLLTSVKLVKPPSSNFDLSYDVKLSCNMGQLIPICNEECVPGDVWKINCESLLRLAPLVSPMMHRCDVYMHYFFVPYRLLWDNFEKFMGAELVGGSVPACPFFDIDGSNFPLSDYLQLPDATGTAGETLINAWFHAAFQFIWNEYYRDQNLQAAFDYKLVDGDNSARYDDDPTGFCRMRNRCWEHDPLTAALPFAQKGDGVDLPIAGFSDVPVKIKAPDFANTTVDGAPVDFVVQADTPANPLSDDLFAKTSDLSATSTTIRDLRRAFKLQEFLERQAVGGTRYNEMIYAMFGVHSSDKRLQRPEYITGAKTPVNISEVLNTTGDGELPQGNMAGHGVSVTRGNYGSYFCEEHGCIMGIMSVMPKTAYFQGIPKKYLKIDDRYQYFWKQFESIGEQEVLNKEVYVASTTPESTFGYVPRYLEYKVNSSRVSGEFRTSLKHWHMAREFATEPNLNEAFVQSDPTLRVFAVTDPEVDHLYCHVYHRFHVRRLMSKYSSPHI